jgi:hypothetical protein
LLPAIAAYFAAMLHNPNNVSLEASPITTQYEFEVARQLAELMGYAQPSWGHLTSGGTVANFEALWVARNLKYFPLAARAAARALTLDTIHVALPTGEHANLVEIDDNWVLLNLAAAEALALRTRLFDAYAESHPTWPRSELVQQVDQQLAAHSISGKGLHRFFAELGDDRLAAGRIFIPATAHYSMQRSSRRWGWAATNSNWCPWIAISVRIRRRSKRAWKNAGSAIFPSSLSSVCSVRPKRARWIKSIALPPYAPRCTSRD